MGIKTKIVASVLLGQMLAGCTMPGLKFRQDYWGKEILEQVLFMRGVTHDGQGEPVLMTPDDLFIQPVRDPDGPDADENEEP